MTDRAGSADTTQRPPTIADLRKEYTQAGLSREAASANPFEQFRLWFDQAVSAGVHEPNAMTLATTQ